MHSAGDRERQLAHFYDLEYRDYVEDVEFYVEYASMLDPDRRLPVLELGCGTGRLLLALAAHGFNVAGVDASQAMLDIAAQHAQERGVAAKISLCRADMRDLPALPQAPFNMAFCALNTFAYLLSTDEQLSMLRTVRPLLVQHGILLIDLTPPVKHLLPPSDGEVLSQGSYKDAEGDLTLHKFVSGYAEQAMQRHHVRFFYDIEAADGGLRRITQEQIFRWTSRYEMELLLRLADYRLEKVYGGYDLEEYTDDSERMIFVART